MSDAAFVHIVKIGFARINDANSHLKNKADVSNDYESLLDFEERAKYQRFHSKESKEEYLWAHTLLRTMLSRATGIAAADLRFASDALGKPHLANPNRHEISFSLSHTRGLVACAVGARRRIGVDVERMALETPVEELAKDVFAAAELDAFRKLEAPLRRERFFQTWVLKEAYLKATGKGLLEDLKSFGIRFDAEGPQLFFSNSTEGDAGRWQLALLDLTRDHAAAVAVEIIDGRRVSLDIASLVPPSLVD